MPVDLKTETIVNLKQAAAHLGASRGGRPVSYGYLTRAILKGVNGHHLEGLKVGSRWLTSIEALQRWAMAQTPGLESSSPGQATPASRRAAAERAALELDRLGL